MKANVYTFKMEYEPCPEIIWRTVKVSSNYTMAQLGYLVLAAFDTLANHMFILNHNGKVYDLYDEEDCGSIFTKLKDIDFDADKNITLIYDFGCEQIFNICLLSVEEMETGTGKYYPVITAGKGKGIIDDVFPNDFIKVIESIDKKKSSDYEYIDSTGHSVKWDYRDFDLEKLNNDLKKRILEVSYGYEN